MNELNYLFFAEGVNLIGDVGSEGLSNEVFEIRDLLERQLPNSTKLRKMSLEANVLIFSDKTEAFRLTIFSELNRNNLLVGLRYPKRYGEVDSFSLPEYLKPA